MDSGKDESGYSGIGSEGREEIVAVCAGVIVTHLFGHVPPEGISIDMLPPVWHVVDAPDIELFLLE